MQEAISVMSAVTRPPVRRENVAFPVVGWVSTLIIGILLWAIGYSLLG